MNSLNFFKKCAAATLVAISLAAYSPGRVLAEELPEIGDIVYAGPMQAGTICDTLEDALTLFEPTPGGVMPQSCGKLQGIAVGTATVAAVVEIEGGYVIVCRFDLPGTPFPIQFGPWRTFPLEGQDV